MTLETLDAGVAEGSSLERPIRSLVRGMNRNFVDLYDGAGAPYLGFVASNGQWPTTQTAHLQWMTRSAHKAAVDITSLKLLYTNVYAGAAEVVTAVDQVWKCALEYTPPGGTAINVAVTFKGAATVTLPANVATFQVSDAVDVRIPAGTVFFVRGLRTQASGNAGFCSVGVDSTVGQCATHAASVTDVVSGTGTFASTDNYQCAPPLAILGITNKPTFLFLGDSRITGFGGGTQGSGSPAEGELARAAYAAGLGFINAGVVGDTANAAATTRPHKSSLYLFASHVVCEYGINDLNGGRTSDQLIASHQALAAYFPGRAYYVTTVAPYTNAGNSAIQMTAARELQRQTYNVRLRTALAATGITGAIDTALYVEAGGAYSTTGQAGLWLLNAYTADGLHETQAGYTALAASVSALLSALKRA